MCTERSFHHFCRGWRDLLPPSICYEFHTWPSLSLYVCNKMQCIEGQGMWKQCPSINYVKCLLLSSSSTKHLQAPCLVARFNDMHPCTLRVLLTSLFSPFFLPSFPWLPSLYLFQPSTLKTKPVEFSSSIPSSMKPPPFSPKVEVELFLLNLSGTLSVVPLLQASTIWLTEFLCISHLPYLKNGL